MIGKVGILAVAIALGSLGCSSGSDSAMRTTTVTVTATPSASTPPAPTGPLPLGQEVTLTGTGVEIAATVFAVDQDSAPSAPRPETGGHWIGADVQVCVKQSTDPFYASWSSWSVSDSRNGNFESSNLTYNQFPVPKFPVSDAVAVGDCARGWVLFAAGDDVVATKVKYAANSSSTPTAWAAT